MHDRLTRRGYALAATLLALAVPASAPAATQTKDDAEGDVPRVTDGFDRADVVQASWDVGADTVSLTLRTTPEWTTGAARFNSIWVYVDTNRDAKSDYALKFGAPYFNSGQSQVDLVTTPNSVPGCQYGNTGAAPVATASIPVTNGMDGRPVMTYSFPRSAIANAEGFDWVVYGRSFSNSYDAFDYAPDAANPGAGRPNPVSDGTGSANDGCDLDGDGKYKDTNGNGDHAADMAAGFTYPDPADPGPGGDPGSGPGGDPGSGPGGSGDPVITTSVTGRVPKVGGLRLDKALVKFEQAGLYNVDFEIKENHATKPPKGIGLGEIVAQSPSPGTPLDNSASVAPKVELEVYEGAKPSGSRRCPVKTIAKDLRKADVSLVQDLLAELKCKVAYDVKLSGSPEADVSKITSSGRNAVTASMTCPKDSLDQDYYLRAMEIPSGLGIAKDWTITSSGSQFTQVAVQVIDRFGNFVENANVVFDVSDVNAPREPGIQKTDGGGVARVQFLPSRKGKVDVCAFSSDEDAQILGSAQFTVVDRRLKNGQRYETITGRVMEKTKDGYRDLTIKGPSVERGRIVASAFDLNAVLNWVRDLATNPANAIPRNVAQAFDATRSGAVALWNAAKKLNFGVGQIAFGKPFNADAAFAQVTQGPRLIGQAGGNLIGQAGGNLIGQAGGNLIGQAGGNVIAVGNSDRVAAGGGNIGGTVDAERGNIVKIPAALIGDHGTGIVPPNGVGLITDAGGGFAAGRAVGLRGPAVNGG